MGGSRAGALTATQPSTGKAVAPSRASASVPSTLSHQRGAAFDLVRGPVMRRLQAKLRVGEANDAAEVEADAMAARFAGGALPGQVSAGALVPAAVQRKCQACGDDDPLQRAAGPGSDSAAGEASAQVEQGVSQAAGGGRPLPAASRGELEGFFGRDFGDVRIHADERAAHMTGAVNAQAFTVGRDVFFARDRYDPTSQAGRGLLAHELTHVVQQGGAGGESARGAARQPFAQLDRRIQRTTHSGVPTCCHDFKIGLPPWIAGSDAHRQIQGDLNIGEQTIPRATKENRGKTTRKTKPGRVDLFKLDASTARMAEIKSTRAGDAVAQLDLQHYFTRHDEWLGRAPFMDADDQTYAKTLGGNNIPRAVLDLSSVTGTDRSFGQFRSDSRKELHGEADNQGSMVYWCRPCMDSDQDPEDGLEDQPQPHVPPPVPIDDDDVIVDKPKQKQPDKPQDKQPGKQPEKQPDKQPGKEPGKQPDKQPGKEPDKQPGKEPDKQPGKEPDKQPEREKPRRRPQRQPDGPSPLAIGLFVLFVVAVVAIVIFLPEIAAVLGPLAARVIAQGAAAAASATLSLAPRLAFAGEREGTEGEGEAGTKDGDKPAGGDGKAPGGKGEPVDPELQQEIDGIRDILEKVAKGKGEPLTPDELRRLARAGRTQLERIVPADPNDPTAKPLFDVLDQLEKRIPAGDGTGSGQGGKTPSPGAQGGKTPSPGTVGDKPKDAGAKPAGPGPGGGVAGAGKSKEPNASSAGAQGPGPIVAELPAEVSQFPHASLQIVGGINKNTAAGTSVKDAKLIVTPDGKASFTVTTDLTVISSTPNSESKTIDMVIRFDKTWYATGANFGVEGGRTTFNFRWNN